jgi:hypothetical protein
MPTPHKHAAVIKAWADGHKVQLKSESNGLWVDVEASSPRWLEDLQYRIKPNTIKYRNFLWKSVVCHSAEPTVLSVTEAEYADKPRESWEGFIRWIGDWQEVEV